MGIREVSSFGLPVDPLKDGKAKEHKTSSKSGSKDQVEVSGKARELFEAERAKKLEVVRERIRDGFYQEQEVTERVVDGLLRDLKSPSRS